MIYYFDYLLSVIHTMRRCLLRLQGVESIRLLHHVVAVTLASLLSLVLTQIC